MIIYNKDYYFETHEHDNGGDGNLDLFRIARGKCLPIHARLMSILSLEPNCSIGKHTHNNESELYYVVEGVATVEDDGIEYTLNVGDSSICYNGHTHCLKNKGTKTLKVLAVIITE